MKKLFLGKEFEFGGVLQNLDESKGNYRGVYLIVCPHDFGKAEFEAESKQKKYKDKKVAVPIKKLEEKWVDAEILYIGKSESKDVIKRVLDEHIPFWRGEKNVSAYGGRVIGQVKDWERFEAWYLKSDNSVKVEKELLRAFKNRYGKLPFANWRL